MKKRESACGKSGNILLHLTFVFLAESYVFFLYQHFDLLFFICGEHMHSETHETRDSNKNLERPCVQNFFFSF